MMLRQPLWLLLLIPAIILFIVSLGKNQPVRVSPVHRMKAAGRTWRVWIWWLPEALTLVFLAIAIFLVAGPERPVDPGTESGNGLSIVIAFDRSSSMSAIIPYGSEKIRRIDGVKLVTRDFLAQRKNDEFALVSFARYPETNTPLTGNRSVLLDFLGLIDVPTNQNEDGTAIGDALVLAAAHLDGKKGVIILLTDGQNNQGEKTPEEGAEIAAKAGVTVYTIGLGGAGYVVQDTAFGKQAVGIPVEIDEDTLSAIARKTGGRYYRADGLVGLAGFYQDIAKRETTKLELSRGQKSELDLERGLIALLFALFAIVIARYYVLRRRDT